MYAACQGANEVVGLEPQSAGSRESSIRKFRQMIRQFDLKGVQALPCTLQNYAPDGTLFDIVLSRCSINHLDEEACSLLKISEAARSRYLAVFRKVNSLMNPGGVAIITDCSRHNLFGDLRLKHPLSPTIDWEIHQSPGYWAQLLEHSGFERPQISWFVPRPLDFLGSLVKNKIVAYFLASRFRLVMRKCQSIAG